MTTITKQKKEEIVQSLRENISQQEAVYFVNYKGIKGDTLKDLRNALTKSNAKMVVARKTLAKIAFEKEGIEFDPLTLDGEVGFVFGYEDGISTAKVISKFAEDELVSFAGGIFEGKVLSSEEVKGIANLPSREELLSKLVGSLSSPTTGLVQVLQGNIRGFVTVLSKAKA